MRTKTLLLAAAVTVASALPSMAQVYSVNIVGYINLTLPKGFTLIANQLNGSPDNKLETVIPAPPENTTIYKFIPNPPAHFEAFNFSADNPGWFPANQTLSPGEGAFIAIDPAFAPTGTTLTLVGEVQLASNLPVINGFSLLSSVIPQTGVLDTDLGFPVRENDNVYRWNPTLAGGKGGYDTYNFSADNPGWFPAFPPMKVGEGFFISGDPQQGGPRTWSRTFTVGP